MIERNIKDLLSVRVTAMDTAIIRRPQWMSQVTMGNFRWGIARDELVNQKEGDQFYMRALI